MFDVTREIIKWVDKQIDKACEESRAKAWVRIIAAALVEAFCDFAIIWCIPLMIFNRIANKRCAET